MRPYVDLSGWASKLGGSHIEIIYLSSLKMSICKRFNTGEDLMDKTDLAAYTLVSLYL